MSLDVRTDSIADIAEVAELYARQAVRVRHLVRLDVQADDALVEDACQIAWMRLVRDRGRVGRDGAVRWLVQVARREVWHQLGRARRELPLDEIGEVPELGSAPDLIDELVARRARVWTLGALPERQRKAMWLVGLGFSYAEIAGRTGESRRSVERQLTRARRSLRRAEAAA